MFAADAFLVEVVLAVICFYPANLLINFKKDFILRIATIIKIDIKANKPSCPSRPIRFEKF